MTILPRIASNQPFAVQVEAGRDYYWCSCGLSAREPFCDGRHEGTPFKPIKFTATEDQTVHFCGCKRSGGGPFCDGTHTSLRCDADAGGDHDTV